VFEIEKPKREFYRASVKSISDFNKIDDDYFKNDPPP
jgi:hypothetical protein